VGFFLATVARISIREDAPDGSQLFREFKEIRLSQHVSSM
jgi:hypothetical protein